MSRQPISSAADTARSVSSSDKSATPRPSTGMVFSSFRAIEGMAADSRVNVIHLPVELRVRGSGPAFTDLGTNDITHWKRHLINTRAWRGHVRGHVVGIRRRHSAMWSRRRVGRTARWNRSGNGKASFSVTGGAGESYGQNSRAGSRPRSE